MPKHRIRRALLTVVLLLAILSGCLVVALRAALPDTFYTTDQGGAFHIASMPWVTVQEGPAQTAQVGRTNADTSRNVTLALFGTIPIKTVRTVDTESRSVQVCGTPFGIKMFSDGALVVAFSDQYTALGTENPAKEAGLKLGDLIVSAAGRLHPQQ